MKSQCCLNVAMDQVQTDKAEAFETLATEESSTLDKDDFVVPVRALPIFTLYTDAELDNDAELDRAELGREQHQEHVLNLAQSQHIC